MLNIVDIVGQYVKLTPEGDSHYTGKCPFCSGDDNSLIVSQENPYWSLDKQAWSCLSCGAHGDRYDFVAKSENITRADAILMIAHHANSGDPFPHARFRIRTTPVPDATAMAAGQIPAAPPPSATAAAKANLHISRAIPSEGWADAANKELVARLIKFRSIIPSYQGATVLNAASKNIVLSDVEYPLSAELEEIAAVLRPILTHVGTVFPGSGAPGAEPGTLSLASDDQAILAHAFGEPNDESMFLVVRLGNASELPVARRVLNSVFPMPA